MTIMAIVLIMAHNYGKSTTVLTVGETGVRNTLFLQFFFSVTLKAFWKEVLE